MNSYFPTKNNYFPRDAKTLDIYKDYPELRKATTLPELPEKLESLECMRCKDLVRLPKLPDTLKVLTLRFCTDLKELPDLPDLLHLDISGCSLLSFPESLPDSLLLFACSDCNLTSLPNLPQGLEQLYCAQQFLIYLPNLPPNLKILNCVHTDIVAIPELSKNLEHLYCNNCPKLTTLPMLPKTLKGLTCDTDAFENYFFHFYSLFPTRESLNCTHDYYTILEQLEIPVVRQRISKLRMDNLLSKLEEAYKDCKEFHKAVNIPIIEEYIYGGKNGLGPQSIVSEYLEFKRSQKSKGKKSKKKSKKSKKGKVKRSK